MVDIEEEKFRKIFPNLAKEMSNENCVSKTTRLRSDSITSKNNVSKKFSNYVPDVNDYLRRCDNKEQGEKIIGYLEKTKEISHEYAKKLRRQLTSKGIRSFGRKKEMDDYLKQDGF